MSAIGVASAVQVFYDRGRVGDAERLSVCPEPVPGVSFVGKIGTCFSLLKDGGPRAGFEKRHNWTRRQRAGSVHQQNKELAHSFSEE